MTAKELRIGNWIKTPNQDVFRIDLFDYVSNGIGKFGEIHSKDTHPLTWYLQDLAPIPLTTEWLERMGFENMGDEWMLYQNENTFIIEEKHGGYVYTGGEGVEFSKVFHYVHQLQNLFYALKFEELELDKK